jgi:hypothetical protein
MPGTRFAGTGRRRRALILGVAAVALATACPRPSRPPAVTPPRPSVEWPAVLGDAQRAWQAGRFDDAERALTTFADQYAGSREAGEVLYWRAVLELDPQNTDGSTKAAAQALDAYLALDSTEHREEAALLRRVTGLITSLSADVQASKAAPLPAAPPPALLKEKDDEILRLRDSLTKTSAELERVRKRLAPKG